MEKIYQVNTNLYQLKIKEIDIVRKTDTYYWTSATNRNAINSNYHQSFDTLDAAKKHLKNLIESKIAFHKSLVDSYIKKMDEYYEMYGF